MPGTNMAEETNTLKASVFTSSFCLSAGLTGSSWCGYFGEEMRFVHGYPDNQFPTHWDMS